MNASAVTLLVSSLLEMPAFMDQVLRDLSPEHLTVQPENDKSPLAEHAWHVRDCEEELYGLRIRKVLDHDNPYLEPMSIGHWPKERAYLA
jgi:hypothetical protein